MENMQGHKIIVNFSDCGVNVDCKVCNPEIVH